MYYSVSATNGAKIIHIGTYRDEATANRVKGNIKDFCPSKGEWKVCE